MTAKAVQFYNLTPAPGGCPWAQKAWIVLEEKAIKYETHIFSKAEKPKDFLDAFHSLWPDQDKAATVPTIVDVDGTKVTESLVVVEYLEEKYKEQGTQLISSKPAHAAKARFFAQLFQSAFQTRGIVFAETLQQVEEGKVALLHGVEVLNTFLTTQALSGGPFVLGQDYSIAEVSTVPFLWRAAKLLPAFRNFDVLAEAKTKGQNRFVEWAQAVLERPSTVSTAVPDQVFLESWRDRVPKLA